MTLQTVSILGKTGHIARRLERYEHRPEQLQMAEAVERAIATGSHLLVEAGTGVGKSFAYLVPAILAAAAGKSEEESKRRRIVVSTHTISLQEQLIARDIPFLNAVLPLARQNAHDVNQGKGDQKDEAGRCAGGDRRLEWQRR